MSKILFIEDDGNYGYVVRTRLTRMGHEVVVTCDGEEGLAQARAVKPDPVLMDLSLPVMDGW